MTTVEQAKAMKATVEQVIETSYAAIDQSTNLYPVAKPVVEIGNQWGRLTVEVAIHWQLQSKLLAALEGAGLAPKMTNFGLVSWVL